MAERIKVSTEDMQATIQKYTSSKQEQQNAYMEVRNAVTAIEATWQGEASTAFRNSFNAMYPNIEKTEAKMDDAINELKAVDAAFQDAETGVTTTTGGLEQGTNPFA